MFRRVWIAVLVAAGAVGCNVPVAPLPPPPPAEPPPVVGHWNLQIGWSEHLWIEADGTFTEAGGSPLLSATSLSSYLASGSWTYADPTLTLDDDSSGPHAFGAVVRGNMLTLRTSRSYVFIRDASDGGADGY